MPRLLPSVPSLAVLLALTVPGAPVLAAADAQAGAEAGAVSAESRRYFEDAVASLRAKDAARAMIQLKNAVRADGHNDEALALLGGLEARGGDPAGAERDLRQALTDGMDPGRVAAPLSEVLLRQNRGADVLALFPEPPADGKPDLAAEVMQARTAALLAEGKTADAVAAAQRLVSLRRDPRSLTLQARVLAAHGEAAPAEAAVDAALQQAPAYAEALAFKADLRHRAGDNPGAMAILDKGLAADPKALPLRFARIALALGAGDAAKAGGDVEAVLADVPDMPQALYYKALLAARKGDLPAADAILRALPPGFLGDFRPAKLLGATVALSLGHNEQALSTFRQLVADHPDDVEARRLLGMAWLRVGDAAKAVDALEPAVSGTDHPDPRATRLLAQALIRVGRAEDAAKYLAAASAGNPGDLGLETDLARGDLQAGKADAAVDVLEKIVKTEPTRAEAAVLLITTLIREGNFDKARAEVEGLRAGLPGSPLPDLYQGDILLAQHDNAGATAAYDRALAVKADFAPARFGLAAAAAAENKPDEAEAALKQIVAHDPHDLRAAMMLARLAAARNRPDDVVAVLQQAIADNPKAAQPRLALGQALIDRKDGARAMQVARDMEAALPDSPEAMDLLARAALAGGDKTTAVETYRALLGKLPDSPVVQVRLAGALVAAGDRPAAKQALQAAVAKAPAYLPATQGLIALALDAGDVDGAVADAGAFRTVVAGDPKTAVQGDILVADTETAGKRPADAVKTLAAAFDRQPSSDLLIRTVRAMKAAGDAARGRALLEQWVQAHPADKTIRALLANEDIDDGAPAKAVEQYEALLKDNPKDVGVLNNLAWVLKDSDPARARDLAGRAYAAAPQIPDIADTYGLLACKGGDRKAGLAALQAARGKDGKNGDILLHLADCLVGDGQPKAARSLLEQALAGDAKFPQADAARAMLGRLP